MPPQLKEAFCPWFGEVMFDTRTQFKYASSPRINSEKPIVVGMAIACHTEQTGGERIGQMHVPENGKNNKGGRIEVDYSSTMVMEIEVMHNHLFHSLGKDDEGETMVLHMDFSPGQVVEDIRRSCDAPW